MFNLRNNDAMQSTQIMRNCNERGIVFMDEKKATAEKNTAVLKKTKMTTMGVVALIFSFIAAGAFGIEEAIAASGPGVTIAMLIIFPLVWSFPLCEMVSELGSLYPTEGGVYSWAREAFGEFWGWQAGLWGALTTWLCQAQYVVLVVGYLAKLLEMNTFTEYAVKIGVVAVFTIINIIGLDWMEKLETVIMVLIIAAFGAVTIVGFTHWNYNPIMPLFNPEEGLFHSVGDGIAIIIWMYLGYECMSNMAEEIEDPQVIPKAMRIANPIIALTYVLPTLAALAAIGSWSAWSTEQGGGAVGYADVLIQYVGSWAGTAFIIIAILANCSIFCSYIAHGSRAFFVMADDNMFPKAMCKVDKRGIPVVSILLLAAFTIFTCQFDFTTLVMATNPIQLYLYLLMVACVLKIRKHYPLSARKKMGLSYMAGGNTGLYVSSACVIAISMFAIYVNGLDYFLTGFIVVVGGAIVYVIFKRLYKGRYLDDPELFPLNKQTGLGVGDLSDIGVYLISGGLMAFLGTAFIYFYEAEFGVEYYLEENETGILSNFYGMLGACLVIGVVLLVAGYMAYKTGQKQDGAKLAELKEARQAEMDDRIREIHGDVPIER